MTDASGPSHPTIQGLAERDIGRMTYSPVGPGTLKDGYYEPPAGPGFTYELDKGEITRRAEL